MKRLGFVISTAYMTFVRLCRRQGLAVMLLALCTALPLFIGPVVQDALSQGVGFEGIHLALTAPEDETVVQTVEQFLPSMADVSRYCHITAMDLPEAERALSQGDVTAILVLPENFIDGILTGANPDVKLILSAQQPMQSLLTLWVGQSATDLLGAFQSAIYTVLTAYEAAPPPGLSYGDVVSQINLRCIRWTLNRQELFSLKTISVTGVLPIRVHYSLSLFLFLLLASAAVWMPVYCPAQIGAMERYQAAGCGAGASYAGTFCGCWLFSFCLVLPGALILTKGNFLSVFLCSLLVSLFTAGFGSLYCLLTANNQQSGLACLLSLWMLGAAGGIVPSVILPEAFAKLSPYSPITWMRQLMAWSGGYGRLDSSGLLVLVVSSVLLALLGGVLYRRRFQKEVNRL